MSPEQTKGKRMYGTEAFLQAVKEKIAGGSCCALVSFDFDNFNFINDLFGYAVGDQVLGRLEAHFTSYLMEEEIFMRVHADHFVLLLQSQDCKALVNRLISLTNPQNWAEGVLPEHYVLVASGGVILVEEQEESITSLLDKANFARKLAKGNHTSHFLFYDKKLKDELGWKKVITMSMDEALASDEFEMYLQPKLLMQTNQLMGAEALVRWKSKKHGMIFPDRFIGVMEQNGFIQEIDFYMLKQACMFIQKTIAEGYPILPISVNFSKLHIRSRGFAQKVAQTVAAFEIPPALIEIEFTETVLSNDFQTLYEVTVALKKLGFKVALDDFGKEYSSLSYLKDLPMDVIKIDKAFLDTATSDDKGKIIISKVVEMIRSLRMVSVMEGVETLEHVEFLNKLGCDIGQGYFFAKPMPAKDYLQFMQECDTLVVADIIGDLRRENAKEVSFEKTVASEFQMDNWELFTLGQNIDMGLMKGYLDGEVTVQYVNDRALSYLGYTRGEFREVFQNSILAFTHPEDVAIVQKNAEDLIQTGKPLGFQTRAVRKDGKVIMLKGRSSCVIDATGRPVGIYAFQDVTEEIERTEALQQQLEDKIEELEKRVASEQRSREVQRISEQRYRLVVEQSADIMFDWDFEKDSIYFSGKFWDTLGRAAVTENVTTSIAVRETIHPEDYFAFDQWIQNTYKKVGTSVAELRLMGATREEFFWMRCRSTAICDEFGNAQRAIGFFSNIDAQKVEMERLMRKAELDPLTNLLNKVELEHQISEYLKEYPEARAAFFIVDIDDFKGVNDTLGHQFGDLMLQEVAKGMRAVFRDTDVIGRIGGDELAVFMKDVDNPAAVIRKAETLIQTLRSTHFGERMKYTLSVSVGIALVPEHGVIFTHLYKEADVALYESKRTGKDRFTVFDCALESRGSGSLTPIEVETRFLNDYFKNDLTFEVFEMLYETKDLDTTIEMIIEQLGKFFGVDRAYIFKKNPEGTQYHNAYEWCADEKERGFYLSHTITAEEMVPFLSAYSEEGILCCSDPSIFEGEAQKVIQRQNVKSFLHCALCNETERVGFIGFEDCHKARVWRGEEIAILGYIARILSVFIKKQQISQALLGKKA